MRKSDEYHKWVEWSEEDGVYIGKCPDLLLDVDRLRVLWVDLRMATAAFGGGVLDGFGSGSLWRSLWPGYGEAD